jgi:hypothetical protein
MDESPAFTHQTWFEEKMTGMKAKHEER